MERYITDERTGLKYELVGDYYLLAGEDEPEEPLGLWGRMRARHLKNTDRLEYEIMFLNGKLEPHLREIDQAAEDMYSQLVRQMAKTEGITEQLKAEDQMAWVAAMNSIDNRVREIVMHELIYTEGSV